jgi:hypothetical protein
MTLPTFFIIGAAKAGTTSLHFYLDQHPQIQMSANKEPNFFGGPENGVPYPPRRVSRLHEYERLFDPAVAVRGEASAGYTNYPRRQGVPERIKELVPQAKFLYIVRDPVARTVSHYQDSVAIGKQRRSLHEALGDLSDPCLPLTCHSRYATQLELYLDHFPPESVMVIDQADLLADRRTTLRDIFAFLSVDDTFDTPRFDHELYRSRDRPVYPASYWRLVERFLAPAAQRVPRGLRRSLRSSVERILLPTVEKPTLDDALRTRLEDLYAGDVERLRALTGKTFPTWSI